MAEEKKKISRAEKHSIIVDKLILESEKSHTYPDQSMFPFKTVATESGATYLCEVVGDHHLFPVDEQKAYRALDLMQPADCKLTYTEVKEVIQLYKIRSQPLEDLSPVEFLRVVGDEPKWTFQRLDFSYPDHSHADVLYPGKAFTDLLGRVTNADALCAFIGSLFIAGSDRQQYVWLQGDGGDGKGSLIRFLCQVLGLSACCDSPETLLKDRFGTSSLVGKRLCCLPDTNNYSFVMSGAFKRLTGDDPVRIEYKSKQPFTTKIKTKFLISSNFDPEISAMSCDIRRIILCKFSAPVTVDPNFESDLWKDREMIVGYCVGKYLDNLGVGGTIKSDQQEAQDLAKCGDFDFYEHVLTQAFVTDCPEEKSWVTPGELQSALVNLGMKEKVRRTAFVRHLKDHHKLIPKQLRILEERKRVYVGLALHDPKMKLLPDASLNRVVTDMEGHSKWKKIERSNVLKFDTPPRHDA